MKSEDILFALLDKMNLETMKNGARLQKILDLLTEQDNAIQGTTYSNRFTIPLGNEVMKIDFSDSENFKDTHPEGVSLYLPGHPVASVYIYNEGPGILMYSWNTQNNQSVANSMLGVGEDRQITLTRRKIKVLNVVGHGAPVTVRMEAIA